MLLLCSNMYYDVGDVRSHAMIGITYLLFMRLFSTFLHTYTLRVSKAKSN